MTDSNKKPTHRAFVVKNYTDKEGKEKGRWLEIGSVWPHKDGKGFDVFSRLFSRLFLCLVFGVFCAVLFLQILVFC